jgi:hypothetical protein
MKRLQGPNVMRQKTTDQTGENDKAESASKHFLAIADPENALGRAYAALLRERAQSLRTPLMLSLESRKRIAEDLDALAAIAEVAPHVFGLIDRAKRR